MVQNNRRIYTALAMKHLETTKIGGIIFPVPFIIILLLGQVFELMLLITDPLGFWVEDIDDVGCIVALPIAPEPRSGIVAIGERSRVTELDTGFIDGVDILNRLGSGAADKLREVKRG